MIIGTLIVLKKSKNRRAKKELDTFIIDCIKVLAPVSTEKTINIPDLSQYLPDDGDNHDESFDGPSSEGTSTIESFESTPKPQAIPGRHLGRKPATKPGGNTQGDGDGEVDGDDPGSDEGGGKNNGDGGDKGKNGGGTGDGGTAGGDEGRTPITVKSRAFSKDTSGATYSLIVHPPQPRPSGVVYLSLAAVGDDAKPTPIRILSARKPNKQELDIPQLGRIGPVNFPSKGPIRIEVTLAEPRRLSFDVTAYEEPTDAAD